MARHGDARLRGALRGKPGLGVAWRGMVFSFTTGVQPVRVGQRSSRESGTWRDVSWQGGAGSGSAWLSGASRGEAGFSPSRQACSPFESGRGV